MNELRINHSRILFTSILRINIVIGAGAGLFMSPWQMLEYLNEGDSFNAAIAVITTPLGGVLAMVSLTLAGYPIYWLCSKKKLLPNMKILNYQAEKADDL